MLAPGGATAVRSMNVAEIAARLEAKRMPGGYWMARCPAHNDRNPSLGIREYDGRPVLKCFAGCSREDVRARLASMGLSFGKDDDPGWETVYSIRDVAGQVVAQHKRVDTR